MQSAIFPLYFPPPICYTIRAVENAPVAQLDSACDSDSQGRRFESCRAYQNAVKSNDFTAFLYLYELFLWRSLTGWGEAGKQRFIVFHHLIG